MRRKGDSRNQIVKVLSHRLCDTLAILFLENTKTTNMAPMSHTKLSQQYELDRQTTQCYWFVLKSPKKKSPMISKQVWQLLSFLKIKSLSFTSRCHQASVTPPLTVVEAAVTPALRHLGDTLAILFLENAKTTNMAPMSHTKLSQQYELDRQTRQCYWFVLKSPKKNPMISKQVWQLLSFLKINR